MGKVLPFVKPIPEATSEEIAAALKKAFSEQELEAIRKELEDVEEFE